MTPEGHWGTWVNSFHIIGILRCTRFTCAGKTLAVEGGEFRARVSPSVCVSIQKAVCQYQQSLIYKDSRVSASPSAVLCASRQYQQSLFSSDSCAVARWSSALTLW